MKLVRYGVKTRERPGLVDRDGNIRDLTDLIADIGPTTLAPETLERLRRHDPTTLPMVQGTPRLGAPISATSKFIAVGLNFREHAQESGMEIPAEPVLFFKATSCITGPFDPIVIPRGSTKTDWEVELGIVIGSTASYVTTKRALEHVAGYLIVHDVSERAFQFECGGQWDKGKGCDTFGPIGPWLVTPDEVGDPQALSLSLDVNGVTKQRGTTATMIFSCAELVSYISQFMTLLPGDIIATGTPPGVGMAAKPPEYLKPGDVVTLSISRLGMQRQAVQPYS